MDGGMVYTALFAIGGGLLGALIAWSVQFLHGRRRIRRLSIAVQQKFDTVVAQRNEFASKYAWSRSRLEQLEADSAGYNAELESVLEKSRQLARNVQLLRKEREQTKSKLGSLQATLASLKQQTSNLQTEFRKSREFYKRELLKAAQRRKELEAEIVAARADQEVFAKAVESSSLEHGSTENMVIAAQLRLGQLEVLERTVSKLEAENERLRDDARQARQEFEERDQELAELERLRVSNRQLVQCVEALENSRKEHEEDAERYRQQADQSEKLSDTLRLKLDDLEKNFAEIEKQQLEAIDDVRNADVIPILRNHA